MNPLLQKIKQQNYFVPLPLLIVNETSIKNSSKANIKGTDSKNKKSFCILTPFHKPISRVL
jgi:hypothetical protein